MERKDREEKERRRIQEELILEQAKREAEAARKKKEEEEIRHRAIEEYNLKQAEEKAKKKKEEEEAAKELKDKMWRTLHNAGYSDEEIEKILKDGEKKKHGAGHDHKTHLLIENGESSSTTTIVNLSKPTYIKVNKKYLETATLEYYELPWEYDSHDSNFLIIKQWLHEDDQEKLFEHTRQLREQKLITYTTTEVRKEHDKLMLVRKKDKRGKSPAVVMRISR